MTTRPAVHQVLATLGYGDAIGHEVIGIQRVLREHQGNISATARALNMHRRTLQRKLLKRPARQ